MDDRDFERMKAAEKRYYDAAHAAGQRWALDCDTGALKRLFEKWEYQPSYCSDELRAEEVFETINPRAEAAGL